MDCDRRILIATDTLEGGGEIEPLGVAKLLKALCDAQRGVDVQQLIASEMAVSSRVSDDD